MARIPYGEPAEGTRAAETLKRTPINVLRMVSHSEEGLRAFSGMGNAILGKSTLDQVLKELAILRVGNLVGAKYEIHHHERIAKRAGMSEAQLEGSRKGAGVAGLSDDDKLVIAFCEEYNEKGVSEATFEKAKARFSHAELVDLALACGYYGLVSRFLNTFGVDIEESVPKGL